MRHFPHWLKAYMEYTRHSEAPSSFHFWTGVSTIAGALQRRVWQEQYLFQWVPNFYIVLVAPAGVATKSTTLNLGMGLLERVDGIKFGPESGSWQGLGDALADATEYFKVPGKVEDEVQSAITVAASELGTFLRPDDEHAISFLTDAWDGRKRQFHHRTKHSGSIEIKRPCLNLIGATTPSWLQRNVPESMIRDGLLSRVVFVFGDQKRHLMSLPSRDIKGKQFYVVEQKLVDDLKEIASLAGEFSFAPEAEKKGGWMDIWYEKHHKNRAVHMASDRYGGYIARKQTHLVKLAMVLSASRSNSMQLSIQDLQEADALLVDAEHSMIKVFESVGVVDEAKHVAEVVQFVRAYGFLTAKEAYKLCHNIMSEKDFLQAFRLAIEGDLLKVVTRNNQRGVEPVKRTTH